MTRSQSGKYDRHTRLVCGLFQSTLRDITQGTEEGYGGRVPGMRAQARLHGSGISNNPVSWLSGRNVRWKTHLAMTITQALYRQVTLGCCTGLGADAFYLKRGGKEKENDNLS